MIRRGALAVAVLWTITGERAVGALVDFNTPGDLATRFNLNVAPGQTIKYFQTTSGGLGNSGAVDLFATTDANHTTAVFNEDSFSFANPGDSVSVSQFVLRQDALITQTPFFHIGILSDNTERLDGGTAATSYASLRIEPVAAAVATDVATVVETKVNGGSRLRTTVAPISSLVAGRWYLVSATFSYNSAADILVSGSVDDWGTTGEAFVSNVLSFGPTSIALSGLDQINGDSSVWAGFRAFHEGGTNLLDNFSATPEPATGLPLLGLAIVGLFRAKRQR